MEKTLEAFRQHVREIAANPAFIHHDWFVRWHLELVEQIALELCEYYPETDRTLISIMAWLHDYGKIIDFDRQYERDLLHQGRDKLIELGCTQDFANLAADGIELLDKNLTEDLHQAPLHVQIISSADGCSHLVGPFMQLWWYENASKPFNELMADNIRKVAKDWNGKIVLPEARAAFQKYHDVLLAQSGELPERFIETPPR